MKRLLLRMALPMMLATPASSVDKVSDDLWAAFREHGEDAVLKVWVYFTDKDVSPENLSKAAVGMTVRGRNRRRNIPADRYDLPVTDEYIAAVIGVGGRDVRASRWLNAVSACLSAPQVAGLVQRDFVARIDPVRRAVRRTPPAPMNIETVPAIDSSSYGQSYIQNHMIGADSLHRLGLDGTGVLIAFLDTGFRTDHVAFDSLTIVGTWDFIHGDSDVVDPDDFGQTQHGTATLSTCGGFDDGLLIGPAFRADYILAKTEYEDLEIEVEEDNWVMAAEWADFLGADIISASLGYLDWYTYTDMDGNTAVTTIAADIAVSRGIVVVVSAGNEGDGLWHYIDAPADADSVVTVGAVTVSGNIASFSSFGPTYDGRLKPELVAMGVNTVCARDIGGYFYKSGTSLSAPLISAGAALVLQANPVLRGQPMEIRRRLIESADRYDCPDFQYGYGFPDLVVAAGFGVRILPIPPVVLPEGVDTILTFSTLAPIGRPVVFEPLAVPDNSLFTDLGDGRATLEIVRADPESVNGTYKIAASAEEYRDTLEFSVTTVAAEVSFTVGPNPFSDELVFYFNRPVLGGYKIEIFTLDGGMVFRAHSTANPYRWSGINASGEKVASGVYIIRVSADGIDEKMKVLRL